MYNRKLKQLAAFIKEIDAQPRIDFFAKSIQDLPDISYEDLQDEKNILFQKELSLCIQNARKRSIDENLLIYQLYQHLFIMLRTKIIYQYAEQIGIEQHLFKDQMNILFKGKFK